MATNKPKATKSIKLDLSTEGIQKALAPWSYEVLYKILSSASGLDKERIVIDCANIIVTQEAEHLLSDFWERYKQKKTGHKKALIEGELKSLEIEKSTRLNLAYNKPWDLYMFNEGYKNAIRSKSINEVLKGSIDRIVTTPESIYPECVGFAFGTVERYYKELINDKFTPHPLSQDVENSNQNAQTIDDVSGFTFAAFLYVIHSTKDCESTKSLMQKGSNTKYCEEMQNKFGYTFSDKIRQYYGGYIEHKGPGSHRLKEVINQLCPFIKNDQLRSDIIEQTGKLLAAQK